MQVVFSTQRGRGCWFSGLAENFLHYGTSPKYKRVLKRGIAALHSVPLAMTLCCEPKAKSQEPTAMDFALRFVRFVKPLCSLWLDRAKSQEPGTKNQEPRAKSQESRARNQESRVRKISLISKIQNPESNHKPPITNHQLLNQFVTRSYCDGLRNIGHLQLFEEFLSVKFYSIRGYAHFVADLINRKPLGSVHQDFGFAGTQVYLFPRFPNFAHFIILMDDIAALALDLNIAGLSVVGKRKNAECLPDLSFSR